MGGSNSGGDHYTGSLGAVAAAYLHDVGGATGSGATFPSSFGRLSPVQVS